MKSYENFGDDIEILGAPENCLDVQDTPENQEKIKNQASLYQKIIDRKSYIDQNRSLMTANELKAAEEEIQKLQKIQQEIDEDLLYKKAA